MTPFLLWDFLRIHNNPSPHPLFYTHFSHTISWESQLIVTHVAFLPCNSIGMKYSPIDPMEFVSWAAAKSCHPRCGLSIDLLITSFLHYFMHFPLCDVAQSMCFARGLGLREKHVTLTRTGKYVGEGAN